MLLVPVLWPWEVWVVIPERLDDDNDDIIIHVHLPAFYMQAGAGGWWSRRSCRRARWVHGGACMHAWDILSRPLTLTP